MGWILLLLWWVSIQPFCVGNYLTLGVPGEVVMKKNKKLNEQPFFIYFANFNITEEGICELFDKAFNYFNTCKGEWNVEEVKSTFVDTTKIFNELKKIDPDGLNHFKKTQQLFYKSEYFDPSLDEPCAHKVPILSNKDILRDYLLKDEEDKLRSEVKWIAKLGDDDEDDYKLNKIFIRFKYVFDFLVNLELAHLKLKEILKKLINNEKLDEKSMRIMDIALSELGKEISRDDIGLRMKETLRTFRGSQESHVFDPEFRTHFRFLTQIVLPIIYNELVEYLKDYGLGKLKQCKECEKFFVAKVKRDDIKFCSKECKQANWNREYKESGKHAEYMREKRPYKDNWW